LKIFSLHPGQFKIGIREHTGGFNMAEPTGDKHYEEKFEFDLWKLIRQRAEEKDISYHDAMTEVLPEYEKTVRYRDTEFEEEQIKLAREEMFRVSKSERNLRKIHEGG
jgi:hypothetical protein